MLLIEPYEDIRQLVERLLHQHGHDVVSVADAGAAFTALERERFDCVIVGSPVVVEESGRNILLLEYVEQHWPDPRPCIVVMTTYFDCERVLSVAQRLDVCAVIAKPFSAEELMAVLGECAAGRRVSAALARRTRHVYSRRV